MLKWVFILSFIIGTIGEIINSSKNHSVFGDGFLKFGLLSFITSFLILRFFKNRCKKCGKWFSYKMTNQDYSNFVDSSNLFSDDVYMTETSTYVCKYCKNKYVSKRNVTKTFKGTSEYKIDKLLQKKPRYRR
jgi:hypothetical protein